MNQQIVICLYNGIVLSNKSNDMCKDMDESENNYAEWEMLEEKRVNTAWFHLQKF